MVIGIILELLCILGSLELAPGGCVLMHVLCNQALIVIY